eukprot:5102668-Prymnesium_polylepis.5
MLFDLTPLVAGTDEVGGLPSDAAVDGGAGDVERAEGLVAAADREEWVLEGGAAACHTKHNQHTCHDSAGCYRNASIGTNLHSEQRLRVRHIVRMFGMLWPSSP